MKKKILVIEDDIDIQDILTLLLTEEGYEVVSSRDGKIVEEIKAIMPDLVLCDIWVPTVKGSEICKIIKSDEATKHIPFILISTSIKLSNLAFECGADDYIQKPFHIKEVTTLLKAYI
ncbi:response regulator [Arcticibacter eurypsychrophilus]|uniref:response regulator n=1 Tax=Arcticibacter eurypsychrophilus TaxID=1434752 RepID=UPI00084DFDFB|nr:response regulator [Arcticibacter eurypsychrophilus]